MNTRSKQTDEWKPCAPGMLTTYARKLKGRQQRRKTTRIVAAGLLVLCVAGVGNWAASHWAGQREYYYGGIACGEVRANLGAFQKGSLPEELASRIKIHLQDCPGCQEFLRQMESVETSVGLSPERGCWACPHWEERRTGQASAKAIEAIPFAAAFRPPAKAYLYAGKSG